MSDLIDRKALLETIKNLDPPGFERSVAGQVAIRIAKNAPTVDAVEVVRCKDCKYWLHIEDGMGECSNKRFYIPKVVVPTMLADDFCSCGERRM